MSNPPLPGRSGLAANAAGVLAYASGDAVADLAGAKLSRLQAIVVTGMYLFAQVSLVGAILSVQNLYQEVLQSEPVISE